MQRRSTCTALVVGVNLLVLVAAPRAAQAAGGPLPAVAAQAAGAAARPTLRLGDRGAAVSELQRRLRDLRAPVDVDGRFGASTFRAVQGVQAARGLRSDGIVGPQTWQVLLGTARSGAGARRTTVSARPTLSLGATGPAVGEAQRLLSAAGYRTPADGRFGPRTQSNVVAFQADRRLTVDGTIGPGTWAALSSNGIRPVASPAARPPGALRTIGAKAYTVRRGDTLASIATANGSTASALAAANRLHPGGRPAAGTTIHVPGRWHCVAPSGRFINDFGFDRGAGRAHEGVDLFASRGAPVLAPVSGRAEHRTGGLGGNAVQLYGDDGHRYYFAHLDSHATAGRVAAGTVIGYVGNTGNAVTTLPHVHFEIHPWGGAAINPFPTLTLACRR